MREGAAGEECGGTAGEDDGGAPLEEDEVCVTDEDSILEAVAFINHPEWSYSSEEQAGGRDCSLNFGL